MMSKIKENRRLQKAVVLSVSLLRHSGEVLAPVLANIALEYKDIPEMWIQMLLMVCTLAILPALLMAAPLVKATSLKTATLISIALTIAGGVMPLFVSDFWLLMVSRIILGIGVGLMNPISASLITENYEGEEKQQLIGGRTATASIGTVFLSLLGGYLTRFGWRAIVLSYLAGIPVMLMIFFLLPQKRKSATAEQARPAKKTVKSGPKKKHPNTALWYVTGLITCFTLIVNVYPTNISMMMSQENLGAASIVAVLMAAYKFSGFLSGILFSKILKLFQTWSMPVGIGITAISLFLLAVANSVAIVFVATVACGFALSWVLALGILNASEAAEAGNDTGAISLVTAGMNLGSFLSPVVMTSMFTWLLGDASRGAFTIGFICMAALTVIAALVGVAMKKKKVTAAIN